MLPKSFVLHRQVQMITSTFLPCLRTFSAVMRRGAVKICHLVLIGLIGMSMPAMAADWGLHAQLGLADNALSLAYAQRDSEKHMREWNIGYRQYTRENVGGHRREEGDGWGLGISWRYYPPKARPFFVGARNDWWVMQVAWEDQSSMRGTTTTQILQPMLLLGWTPGNERLSADLYFTAGYGFNVARSGEQVSDGAALSFGAALRF